MWYSPIRGVLRQTADWEQEGFYFDLYDQLYTYSRREQGLRSPAELAGFEQWLQHPWLADEQAPQSVIARQLFNGIHYTYRSLRARIEGRRLLEVKGAGEGGSLSAD